MSQSPNKRLKAFLDDLSDSYGSIADKTGLSRRTWHRLVEEGVSINSEYLLKLREIYGADINWILTGEKSVTPVSHSESVHTYAHLAEEPAVDFDPEQFVSVPFYPNVYASGGEGLIAENEKSLPITFRQHFFSNTLFASPKNCFMIRIKGDSMHPRYPDGSDLLVDQGRRNIKEGPGFLVRIEDTLYCKLLSKLPGGKMQMRSINEDYRSVEVDPKAQGFEIIGEVVWHAQKSKYI